MSLGGASLQWPFKGRLLSGVPSVPTEEDRRLLIVERVHGQLAEMFSEDVASELESEQDDFPDDADLRDPSPHRQQLRDSHVAGDDFGQRRGVRTGPDLGFTTVIMVPRDHLVRGQDRLDGRLVSVIESLEGSEAAGGVDWVKVMVLSN